MLLMKSLRLNELLTIKNRFSSAPLQMLWWTCIERFHCVSFHNWNISLVWGEDTIHHYACPLPKCVCFVCSKNHYDMQKVRYRTKKRFFLPFIWCMFTLFHFVFNARNSHCCVKSDVLQRLNCDCLLMVDKHALFSLSKWNCFSPNCQPYIRVRVFFVVS